MRVEHEVLQIAPLLKPEPFVLQSECISYCYSARANLKTGIGRVA